jgi:SH3 domain-containing protein
VDHMAALKEFFAPIPGRIYRVLQAPGPTGSFDSAAFEMTPAFNSEIGPDSGPVRAAEENASPSNREKERKPVVPAAKAKEVITPSRAERASIERRSGEISVAASPSRFEVVENSYVRNEPSDKAQVVATLRPGTRIQLVRRAGDYLQVRSLGQEAIRGYVHREDAFFRPF